MTQANTDFGRVADDMRRAATSFALLAGSASLLGRALNEFRQFEKQLVLTNAIAGGTVRQFNAMKDAARSFSLVTTTSAIEAGAALQQLAQAGFTASESLAGMAGVLLLAQATLSDVRVTSDVLSSNIRAFGLAASDTARIANLFTAAITGSLATMDKLAFAMRQVAPVAELAGLSIEETAAALGVLFNIGLRGEQAGTALRNIIIRLIRPLGEAGTLLREAGIATRDATGEFRNLADILTDIGNSNIDDAGLARIFETEALAGAKAFINALKAVGETGESEYSRLLTSITGTDRAIEIAAANLATFDGAMGLFSNTLKDVAKDLGEALAPAIIAVTEFIRDLVANYKNLDEGQKALVQRLLILSGVLVGALASFNALFILIRGLGIPAMAGFTLQMLGFTTATNAAAASINGVFLTAITRLGGAGVAFLGLIPGVKGFAAAAALAIGPASVAIVGVAALAAGAYAAVKAFDALFYSASELEESLRPLDNAANAITRANTMEVADSILGEGTVEEITSRVEAIREQILLASGTLGGLELAGFNSRAQDRAGAEVNASGEAIRALDAEFEGVRKFLDLQRETEKAIQEANDNAEGAASLPFSYAGIVRAGAAARVRGDVDDAFDELSTEAQVRVDTLREKFGDLLTANQEADAIAKELKLAETVALEELLITLTTAGEDVVIPENFQPALIALRSDEFLAGITGETFFNDLAEDLANLPDAATFEDVFRTALAKVGYDAARIEEIIITDAEVKADALTGLLAGLGEELALDTEKLRITLLEQELAVTDSIVEAQRLAQEIGLAQLEVDLADLAEDNIGRLEEIIVQFGLENREGQTDIIQDALDDQGIDFDAASAGFADVLSGKAFIDSVNAQIDGDTTLEEAKAIAAQQGELFEEIIEVYIQNIIDTIEEATPEQIASIRAIGAAFIENSVAAFGESFGDTDALIADEVDRINREAERSRNAAQRAFDQGVREREGAARDAERAAKDALDNARDLQDAFLDVAKANAGAEEAYFEAIRGVGIGFREDFMLDLEVERIAADAEEQILKLRRQIEDVATDFSGSPEQLEALSDQYDGLIGNIERARDAEIEAAGSFTQQMERRSAALDLFIRDLDDIAAVSTDTFTKVGAGVASAFAEFNYEIVTLVDITKEATLSFIDATSNAFSDFIFDGENAFENFKNSLLDISKQVVAGFAKAFIQQSISSITGGEGSIFGNQQQPSGFGDSGTPSVGTGGILGQLFPGLSGAFGGNEFERTDQNPMDAALQVAADDAQTAHSNFLRGQANVWGMFTADLQQVLNTALQSIASTTGTATPSIAGGGNPMQAAMQTQAENFARSGDAFNDGILETANALGVSARDLLTVISYETGGTFDPRQAGPTTQHGQHRGLIQFGEEQAGRAGVDFSTELSAIQTQLGANGGIVSYLRSNGFEEGMGILDLYSTINAGAPGLYNRTDENNGGARGTVLEKVNEQFGGHYDNADRILAQFEQSVPALEQATQELSSAIATTSPADDASRIGIYDQSNGGAAPSGAMVFEPQVSSDLSAAATQLQGASGEFQSTGTSLNNLFGAGVKAPPPIEVEGSDFTNQLANVFDQFSQGLSGILNQHLQGVAAALGGAASPIEGGGMLGGLLGGGGGGAPTGGTTGTGSLGLGTMGGLNTPQGVGALQSLFSFAGNFFDKGGYTGDGGKLDPAGIVHKGEFVFDQAMTKKYMPLFQQMQAGKLDIDGYMGGGIVGGGNLGGLIGMLSQLRDVYNLFDKKDDDEERDGGLGGILDMFGDGGGISSLLSLLTGGSEDIGQSRARGASSGGGLGGLLGMFGGGGGGGGLGGLFSGLFGMFNDGGFTGAGGKLEPAGIVHKGEFVFDQAMTNKYLPLFQAMHKGEVDVEGYSNGGLVGSQYSSFGDSRMFDTGSVFGRANDSRSDSPVPAQAIQQQAGDTMNFNVKYEMKGGQTNAEDRAFRRSANQHAKRMANQIEKAKRNT